VDFRLQLADPNKRRRFTIGAVEFDSPDGESTFDLEQARAQPVSRAEFETAQTRKDELMRDRKFTEAYMASDGPERKTLTLLNVILSSRIKEGKAA
jgi:hypothetical protein